MEQHPLLPDSFDLAMSHLMTLFPKLRKHPELLAEYDKIISEQTSKGFVSDVDPDEPLKSDILIIYPTMQYYGKIGRQQNVELCMMPHLKQ